MKYFCILNLRENWFHFFSCRYQSGFIFFKKPMLLLLLIFLGAQICAAESVENSSDLSFSIDKKPLLEAVRYIERKTGYGVLLKDIDSTLIVSGRLQNGDITKFFRDILRQYNTSVIINDINKKIVVISLGPRDPSKGNSINIDSGGHWVNNEKNQQHNNEERGMHELQAKSIEHELNNQDSNEERGMHELQAKSIEHELNDQDNIDPISGLSLGETKRIHREQAGAIEKEMQQQNDFNNNTF